jgi:hypothetical protein
VKDAVQRLLEEDARFRAAVQVGIEQADRGDFIDVALVRCAPSRVKTIPH